MGKRLPVARRDLIVEAIGEELVIVDERRSQAHALRPDSATIWHLCDGSKTVEQIAGQAGIPVELAELALQELARLDLIESDGPEASGRVDRRSLLKRAAALSTAPLVLSAAIPAAAVAGASMFCPTGGTDDGITVTFSGTSGATLNYVVSCFNGTTVATGTLGLGGTTKVQSDGDPTLADSAATLEVMYYNSLGPQPEPQITLGIYDGTATVTYALSTGASAGSVMPTGQTGTVSNSTVTLGSSPTNYNVLTLTWNTSGT